jgi:hypothetical protein
VTILKGLAPPAKDRHGLLWAAAHLIRSRDQMMFKPLSGRMDGSGEDFDESKAVFTGIAIPSDRGMAWQLVPRGAAAESGQG